MATINNERDALLEIIRLLQGPDQQTRDQLLKIAYQGISAGDAAADDGVQRDSKAWTNSSTISQAVYFPATRVLRLHFTSGAIYDFFEVHPSTWNGMKEADSPGKYYNTSIKQHENKKVL